MYSLKCIPGMKVRWIFLFFSMCTACAPTSKIHFDDSSIPLSAKVIDTERYRIQQRLTLYNEGDKPPEKQNLWVALIRDVPPYQQVLSKNITPKTYTQLTDENGNQYAEFDFSDHPPNTNVIVEITYDVAINEIIYDLGNCQGEQPDEFTQAELHIESGNPQIRALASNLSRGNRTVCQKVRAFYDYAGDELTYTFNRRAWGAQATFGLMGADCTEFADLVIALSRAEGIPARYYEGLLYLGDKDERIAQTEHAWLDAYFPGVGWVGMDPTLGRRPAIRDQYFAHYTADHIIVTTGRNPSTLRGASYWSHLYWPGDATTIRIIESEWTITPIQPQ